MTTGVRRGNDNEGPLVNVEPQEGVVGDDVPIPFEVVAGQEVVAVEEAPDREEDESDVLVGARLECPRVGWRLGVGASFRVQRDQQPRR